MDPRFLRYDKTNFATNLRNLRKVIKTNIAKIQFDDQAALDHINNFPPSDINNRGNVRLDGHPAKNLLELDVAAGYADNMKPSELKKTRPEYECFGTKQWCKAVNKERSKQKQDEFWIDERNREGARRHAERRTARLREAGMIL